MTRDIFNNIVHQEYRRLYFIANRILKNPQEAEDVVQDTFFKLWEMRDKLDSYDDIGALAVTITKNSSIDRLRKWQRTRDREDVLISNRDLFPSPHEEMENSESVSILYKIIDELPVNMRKIIYLREIEGLAYEEIAERTKLNVNNLRVLVSRARNSIKEKYLIYTNEEGRT